jgi:hypothetical protein
MRIRSPQMTALLAIVVLALSVLLVATPKAKVIPAHAASAQNNAADQIEFTKIVPANPSTSPYWAPLTGDGSN